MTAQKIPSPERPTPTISVIVPVFNVQDHIGACLESLRDQSFSDFEAIVVDDGSTDDSPARMRAAIAQDPRFRVIHQENRGLSGARNTGLEVARGTFIAFLDGDDRYDPEFLAQMHAALENSEADWVACGLRNMHADGHSDTHSAIHDSPRLQETANPTLFPLNDWKDVIPHFPSSWNKLYRRSLIEGLRFDEDTWFEDHAFFLRAAARTKTILHLPQALYLQTRGRPQQITGTDSERVFEQLTVLDTLSDVMAGPEKPGHGAALSKLAHRLFHERSSALRAPLRRARFVSAARDWLKDRGLPALPGPDLPPSWKLELSGSCPLSVVIPWDGQEAPLRVTLAALNRQVQRGFETLIVADDPSTASRAAALAVELEVADVQCLIGNTPDPGAARNVGLAQAKGEMVVFADAGDQLMPFALAHWTDAMLRAEADFGFSQFRVGLCDTNPIHSGFHDLSLLGAEPPETGPFPMNADLALALHCHPTAKIFRRRFLVENALRFGTGARSDWQISIGAALTAGRSIYFAWPGAESSEAPECRRLWTAQTSPEAMARTLEAAAASWSRDMHAKLPADWPRRLYARALWEVWNFSGLSPAARSRFRLEAIRSGRRRGWQRLSGPLDPYVNTPIHALLGQPLRFRETGCIPPPGRANTS